MKKIICFYLVLILAFSSFSNSFIFPIKFADAETLSTDILPSTLSGMQLIQVAMLAPAGCYAAVSDFAVPEFAVGVYQSASNEVIAVNVGKYSTNTSAENIARGCTEQLKADVGTSASWQGIKSTTVSGYSALYDIGEEPGYGFSGLIFVMINGYLISITLVSSSVSQSDLESIATTMVSRLSQVFPPSGKNDGEYCSSGSQCKSGHCYNNVCCASGKDCCTENSHCEEFFSCDRSVYYCTQKKTKGSSCQFDSDCQTNYCGYAGSTKICCTKGPMGACCKTQSDCGGGEYCSDFGCKDQEKDGSQCGYDYQCNSGYCEGGKCKARYRESAKLDLNSFCKHSYECESGRCNNGLCCEKGNFCCSLTQECKKDKGEWWRCVGGRCAEDTIGKEVYEKERKRKDGYCAADESCYTPDCEYTVRCGINEACTWGGERERACIGCLASIVSELNIVYKAVDILQGIGCDVMGNLISGLLSSGEAAMEKVYSAFVSIIFVAIDLGLQLSKTVALLVKLLACIDGQFGLGKTVLLKLGYALTEISSSVSGKKTAMVALESPAGLIVKDSKGNATGINAAGQTFDDVPDSVFIEFPKSDLKLVLLTDTGGDKYEVITRATAAGTINVKTARSDGETIEKMDFDNITQDSETQTDLDFKTKVGSGTTNMRVPLKGGGASLPTGQLSIEKIDETKIPDKFRTKGLNVFGGFSLAKIFEILIALVILVSGFILVRKKKEPILRFLKNQKEKLAKKSAVKKPAESGSRKSIILNIIKFIICLDIGAFGIMASIFTANVYGNRKAFLVFLFLLVGLAALRLCYKIIKCRKLTIKHIIIAILLGGFIAAIIWGFLLFSAGVVMR